MTSKNSFDVERHYGELAQRRIPGGYAATLLETAQANGIDLDTVTQQLGMDITSLCEPDASVSFADFAKAFLEIYYLSELPQLGLLMGERLPATAHGLFGLAVLSADNLGEALQLMCDFVSPLLPVLEIRYEPHDNAHRLFLNPQIPLFMKRREIIELFLAALLRTMREAAGHLASHDLTLQVDWPAPSYQGDYARLLQAPVLFDSSAICIELSPRLALRPLPLRHRQTFESTRQKLLGERRRSMRPVPLRHRVAAWLNRAEGMVPTLEESARHFNMSARTLRQKLYHDGTTYRELVSEEITNRATFLLARSSKPISHIAEQLGFSDTANFSRAFKRELGQTPLNYRRAQQAGGDGGGQQ